MKTSLLIMAAGIGSRYGGGIKQLESVGPNGEIIMDYSVHDAIEAGFNKIVFIIRKDIEEDFKEIIGNRIEEVCTGHNVEVAYAYQELENIPAGIAMPVGRRKPWGTGHAVLACKEIINEPFAVINADDYYGKTAFTSIHDYLINYTKENSTNYCMAGFKLKNTLSDNGGVTRGVCEVNEEGQLTNVVETYNIVKTETGAASEGKNIDVESYVSMNMWGLTPEYINLLEEGFVEFFEKDHEDVLKSEYLLPIHIGELLTEDRISVELLETNDKWFGMTYREDKAEVTEAFDKLIEEGKYQNKLFTDL